MNEKQKKIIKIFSAIFFVYGLLAVAVNWNAISWVFNYEELGGLASNFFGSVGVVDASSTDQYIQPETVNPDVIPGVKTVQTDQQAQLEVPKIGISVPIVFPTTTDPNALHAQLDKGVVYYPGSVDPGKKGQIVILGHSAPPGWPHIKHDWVFSDLQDLKAGDVIMVDIKNVQYTYKVIDAKVVKRGADLSVADLSPDKNILMLVSCWPPGKDLDRLVVRSELVLN